jgi:hypothetical protein
MNEDAFTRALNALAELLAEGQLLRVRVELPDGRTGELNIQPAAFSAPTQTAEPATSNALLLSPIEKSVLAVATPNGKPPRRSPRRPARSADNGCTPSSAT